MSMHIYLDTVYNDLIYIYIYMCVCVCVYSKSNMFVIKQFVRISTILQCDSYFQTL
jgi:hypothetical protein